MRGISSSRSASTRLSPSPIDRPAENKADWPLGGCATCTHGQPRIRHLAKYLCDLYQMPGIAGTVNMDHIKRHYCMSMVAINPIRIVALGPELDFAAPHDRGRFEQQARNLQRHY